MKRKLLIILITFLGLNIQSFSQGDLLVSPKRVVFEGNKKIAEISLVNLGKDTALYSISFVQKNMKEDGSFVTIEVPDSGQMFADPFLRFFPRYVTLAPQEAQVVRLQLRRSKDMVPGEYRSHLYFRAEKNDKPLGLEKPVNDTTQLSVELIPIFGITIPVIIRAGEVSVALTLNDLKMEIPPDSIPTLKLTINRSGNISGYGNLITEYFPEDDKSYVVGIVNGVGVYTNIYKRNISIKLNQIPGMAFKNGKLKVRFTSPDDSKKYEVYTETELQLK